MNRPLAKRRKERSRGATTVEVAITFPILILLVMLVFEMSRMMMVQQSLEFAAQRGARTASLATTLSESQVTTVVRAGMLSAIPNNASIVSVGVTPSGLSSVSTGTAITVNTGVDLDDVSWVPGTLLNFLGNPTLSASAVQDRE